MRVKVEELEKVTKIVLERAVELGINELNIEDDFYWIVSPEDLFNFTIGTPKTNVGSLNDDYENIMKIFREERQPSIVDFDRVSILIRAIGESICNSSKIY